MRQFDDAGELVRVGLRRYAVAEIQDVRARRTATLDHVAHVRLQHRPRGRQQRRVDVALHRDIRPEDRGGFVERLPPVDPHAVGHPVETHVGEERAGPDTEVDAREADTRKCRMRMRGHEGAVVGGAEGSGPAVEELDDGCSGVALRLQESARDLGEPARETVPRIRVGVHHGPRPQVLLGGAALDEVGREREGCTRETDQRGVAELCRDEPNGLGDGRAVEVIRVDGGDALDIGRRAHRVREHRAATGLDLHLDAGQAQRDDDVAEEHGRVDPVAAHRLQGDLGCEGGGEAGVEHPRPDTQVAVLGKRPAGLSHEPHRGVGWAVAGEGAQERSVGEGHESILPSAPYGAAEFGRSNPHHRSLRYTRSVLLCVTASHKTASFELLERLSRTPDDVAPTIVGMTPCVQGAVVLATCNRFEAYVEMDEPVTAAGAIGVEAVIEAVESATGIAAADLDGAYTVHSGRRVAEHLFSVASGLESVVSGEGEIAGQVRRALKSARKDGTTSPELERLFQRASQAQRKVKNVTALGRAGRSLVRLALELADSRIADWSAERVLLVGTGAYAAVTLATLRERGAVNISVYSPSGRAEVFAAKHGIRPVPADEYARTAARSSLLITCTTATEPVLGPEHLRLPLGPAEAGCPVGAHNQLVVDLGMPRNVDPAVASLEGVALLDLETIRLHAPLEELQATDAARSVVREAAETFHVVGARQSVTPSVVAFRSHIFELLEREIDRARARGDEDGKVEQALRHLSGVLLHTPTVRAHALAAAGRADEFTAALAALYGIAPEAESSEDAATA